MGNNSESAEWASKYTPKIPKKGVRKLCFRGRQVGAFSVFGEGVYRNPVHKIGVFGLFFGKLTDLGVDVI